MLKKRIILVFFYAFPFYCVTTELKNRKFTEEKSKEFASLETIIGIGKVISTTACASLCTSNDECCTANYNTSTQNCHLNRCCFPDTRPSENGIIIKKVAKPNMDGKYAYFKLENIVFENYHSDMFLIFFIIFFYTKQF